MAWIRVDDSFYDNDKMLAAGSIGRDLYWHGMAFCNRNLTDGLIPASRALLLVDFTDAAVLVGAGGVDGQDCAPIAVQRLLDAGLWHEDGHDCPDCVQPGPRHYVIHDYLKYQPSKADVEKKAEDSKKRVAAWREARKAGNAGCNAVTNADVTPDVTAAYITPQTQPQTQAQRSTSVVTKEGGVTKRNARDPKPPRPQCLKHENGNPADEPCRTCKRIRQWDEQHAAQDEADELQAKRLARERAESCPTCHGTNWIPDTEPAIKCAHGQVISNA